MKFTLNQVELIQDGLTQSYSLHVFLLCSSAFTSGCIFLIFAKFIYSLHLESFWIIVLKCFGLRFTEKWVEFIRTYYILFSSVKSWEKIMRHDICVPYVFQCFVEWTYVGQRKRRHLVCVLFCLLCKCIKVKFDNMNLTNMDWNAKSHISF